VAKKGGVIVLIAIATLFTAALAASASGHPLPL